MDKFSNFVSTVKDADVWQQEAASGTSDKLVKCFAVIGLLATAKTIWSPLKRYVTGEKVAPQAKPVNEAVQVGSVEKQRARNLKERYGGQWAVITEGSDQTTH
jgi:hypothetical protein